MNSHIWRVCCALTGAENVLGERYRQAIKNAEKAVGEGWAEAPRALLVKAVKLNVGNRKEYPFELLVRRYSLPIGKNQFGKQKKLYCNRLAAELDLIR